MTGLLGATKRKDIGTAAFGLIGVVLEGLAFAVWGSLGMLVVLVGLIAAMVGYGYWRESK